MAFFAEKVRRKVPGNFTFLLMTDREDLDDQIYETFVGCGITDEKTPRAASGEDSKQLLKENHRYVFSLIHKFNQDVNPNEPYSERDDIIVISDEAHRTQAGRLARNMRLALPNAAFIGFTGTPLFKQDEITKRIFGDYVSRYDFKRSEEDGATVKLVYENRGEKLGVARARPERPYRREDRGGRTRSRSGGAARKAARQGLRGHHRRRAPGQDRGGFRRALRDPLGVGQVDVRLHRQDHLRPDVPAHHAALAGEGRSRCARLRAKQAERRRRRRRPSAPRLLKAAKLKAQADWMDETIIEIIISEAQNEVARLQEVGLRHHPAPRS